MIEWQTEEGNEFGQRLRAARKARGWTQEQLGAATGITGPAVAQIESGRTRRPLLENVKPLANALGITAGCLEGVEWDLLSLAEELGYPAAKRGNDAAILSCLPCMPAPPAVPLRGRTLKRPRKPLTKGQQVMCYQFRLARLRQGKRQKDVCIEAFGHASGYLSSIEREKIAPGPKLARKLCAALGLDFNKVYCPPGGDE